MHVVSLVNQSFHVLFKVQSHHRNGLRTLVCRVCVSHECVFYFFIPGFFFNIDLCLVSYVTDGFAAMIEQYGNSN